MSAVHQFTTQEHIPTALRQRARWLLWKWGRRPDGKIDKLPVSAVASGEKVVDALAAANWTSFETAWARNQRFQEIRGTRVVGLNFVITDLDRIIGVDLDTWQDPESQEKIPARQADGSISAWAAPILDALNSYTEVSPSSRGFHVWCFGSLPPGHRTRRNGVEVYSTARWFTVTGHRVFDYPADVEDRTRELATFHAAWFPPDPGLDSAADAQCFEEGHDLDDESLLTRAHDAANGEKFARLWAGDMEAYPSHSEADLALVGLLLFWTGASVIRTDRLFRRSGLMRDKWDQARGATTYGARTIQQALLGTTETYSPHIEAVLGPHRTDGSPVTTPVVVLTRASSPGSASPQDASVLEDDQRPHDVRPTPVVLTDEPASPPPSTTMAEPFQFVTPDESFVTHYIRYAAQCTDAHPLTHEAVACTVLSALAGPGPRLAVATRAGGWPLCIWSMYLANSTLGRKTTVLEFGRHVVEATLGAGSSILWEASSQGLIQRLVTRDHQTSLFTRDEYVGILLLMNRGHLGSLAQTLIRAHDALPLENIRTSKRNKKTGEIEPDSDKVQEPYLVKLCAATRDRFLQVATIDNFLDGLLARFVFYTATTVPKPPPMETMTIRAARDAVLQRAEQFHLRCRTVGPLTVAPDTMQAYWELDQDWEALAAASALPDAARPALKRLGETALKVAALLAIDLTPSPEPVIVSPTHFLMGAAIVDRWRPTTLMVVESAGQTRFRRHCDAVRRLVTGASDGVPVRQVYRLLHLRKKETDAILETLESEEYVRLVRIPPPARGGHSSLVVYPVPS